MNLVQTTDELYLLNTINNWRSYNSLEFSYEDSHSRHARTFISLINPVYLSDFKNLESLNNFSFIQVRDGVIDLLKFFFKYRTPGQLSTKLYIDHRLSHLVPNSWKDNVSLYKNIYTKKNRVAKDLIFSHTYITDQLERETLEKIQKENSFENLFFYGDCAPENLKIFHKINSTIEDIFKLKPKFLSVDDIRSMGAKNMMLFEDRTTLLSSTKSYLSWELIVAGAMPYHYEESDSIDYLESPYSSIETLEHLKCENDPARIYEWIEKNGKDLHLYEFEEEIQNTNNLHKPLNSQTVNFALSVLNNETLFYS